MTMIVLRRNSFSWVTPNSGRWRSKLRTVFREYKLGISGERGGVYSIAECLLLQQFNIFEVSRKFRKCRKIWPTPNGSKQTWITQGPLLGLLGVHFGQFQVGDIPTPLHAKVFSSSIFHRKPSLCLLQLVIWCLLFFCLAVFCYFSSDYVDSL